MEQEGKMESERDHGKSSNIISPRNQREALLSVPNHTVVKIVQRHEQNIYQACLWVFNGNHEDAEDALSDLRLKLILKGRKECQTLERLDNPKAWLVKVARNHCYDVIRRRQKFREMINHFSGSVTMNLGLGKHEPTPEEFLVEQETRVKVNDALDVLPEHLRSAYMERVFNGLSYSDMANLFGISEPNARKRVELARKKIMGVIDSI